jgi:hypothetical protein
MEVTLDHDHFPVRITTVVPRLPAVRVGESGRRRGKQRSGRQQAEDLVRVHGILLSGLPYSQERPCRG